MFYLFPLKFQFKISNIFNNPNRNMTGNPTSFLDRINSEFEQAFIVAVEASYEMGEYDDSLVAAKRVFAYNPNSKIILQFFPNFSNSIERISKLIEVHGSQLESKSTDFNQWSTLGYCYLTIGDFPNAFAAFAHALRLSPDCTNPIFWYAMGVVYGHYSYLEKAILFYNKVKSLDPYFSYINDINFRIGLIKRSLGFYDVAIEYFESVKQEPPSGLQSDDVIFQIAYTYQVSGNFNKALLLYQDLYSRYPNCIKLIQQFCWFLLHVPNPPTSSISKELSQFASFHSISTIISQGLSTHPRDPFLTFIAARLAMRNNDMNEAYQNYHQCISFYRDSAYFWCSLGLLYYQNDQYRDAVEAYQAALYHQPNLPEAWLNIGLIFEQQKDLNTAVRIYQTGSQWCTNCPEFEQRINNINISKTSFKKIIPNYQLIDIDDSKFMTPIPKEITMLYNAAVPELPIECYGIGDDAADFKMFSTYPKSIFI